MLGLLIVVGTGLLWAADTEAQRSRPNPLSDAGRQQRTGEPAARVAESEEADDDGKDDEDEKPVGLFGEYLHGRNWLSLEYLYTGDCFNNTRGGLSTRNATTYRGNLDLILKADMEKMGFAPGGSFFLYGQNGHGRGPTRDFVGDYQVVSSIDAPDFMQVSEFHYEREFFDKFAVVRIGKQDCNADFAVVDLGGDFVNSSFGMPPVVPMPSFPAPTAGISTFFNLNENIVLKAGVWDGEPQIGNWGFSGSGVTFTIGEVKVKYNLAENNTLPGDFHVGAWYHSGQWEAVSIGSGLGSPAGGFALRRTRFGSGFGPVGQTWPVPLGAPLGAGPTLEGNHGVYLGMDQLVFKEIRDDEKDKQGLGLFVQYGWSPGDRNYASQYLGGGLVYRGLIPNRDEDMIGAGVAHLMFSDELPQLRSETAVEVYYKAQITPWASLQPDLQYIAAPNGDLPDALVVGLRFAVNF